MKHKIYTLSDPRTNEVRYVGQTQQPLTYRVFQHIRTASVNRCNPARCAWVNGLVAEGLKPAITLLEEVSEEEWRTKERDWLAHYKAQGADLLNSKAAGGGGSARKHVDWTAEIDARLGKETDSIIAADLGVTRKAVAYRRNLLKIPASFDRTLNAPPPPMGGHNKRDIPADLLAKIGTVPDYALAAECGLTKNAIAERRRALGIPSFAQQTGNRGTFKKGNFPGRWLKPKPD